MAASLKVYGWRGWRNKCPPAPNGNRQTREICAAKSMAAVARIMGCKYTYELSNLDETGNSEELEIALAEPGVVFWHALSERPAIRKWHKAETVKS